MNSGLQILKAAALAQWAGAERALAAHDEAEAALVQRQGQPHEPNQARRQTRQDGAQQETHHHHHHHQ